MTVQTAVPVAVPVDIAAALSKQADKLLQTGLKNPLIQFDRTPAPWQMPSAIKRVWLGDLPALDGLIDALPESDGKKSGGPVLGLYPLLTAAGDPAPKPDDKAAAGVNLSDADLRAALAKLAKTEKMFAEETGLDVLRLITGFLEWRAPGAADGPAILSPLLALPVSVRTKASRSGIVRIGDCEDNITLRQKLKNEYGIDLPEWTPPEDGDKDGATDGAAVMAYLAKVTSWCAGIAAALPGAQVIHHAALGALNFATIRLFKDLHHPAMRKHRLVRDLLNPDAVKIHPRPDPVLFDRNLLSVGKEAPDPFPKLIFDADGSQHAVLVDVLQNGKDLTVEGPPGTGKSQTIANLIAAAIGSGKRVLFVSQKLAALEVVRARLAEVGLGAFCLDLHGTGTTKSGFMQRIKQRLDLLPPQAPKADPAQDRDEAWRALALAPQALAEPVDAKGQASGFEAIWHADRARTRLGAAAAKVGALTLRPGDGVDRGAIEVQLGRMADLWPQLHAQLPGFPKNHPFSAIQQKTPLAEKAVLDRLRTVADAAEELVAAALSAADWIGPPPPAAQVTRAMAGWIEAALDRLPEAQGEMDGDLLARLLTADATPLRADLDRVVSALRHNGSPWARGSLAAVEQALSVAGSNPPSLALLDAREQALRRLATVAGEVKAMVGAVLPTPDHLRDALARLACPPPPDDRSLDGLSGLEAAVLKESVDLQARWAKLLTARHKLGEILSPENLALDAAQAAAKMAMIAAAKALNFGPTKKIAELPPSIQAALAGLAATPSVTAQQVHNALKFLPNLRNEETALAAHPLGALFSGDDSANEKWCAWCLRYAELPPKVFAWLTGAPHSRLADLRSLCTQIAAALAAWDQVIDGSPLNGTRRFTDLAKEIAAARKTSEAFAKSLAALGIPLAGAAAKLAEQRALLAARDRLIAAGWCDQTPGPFADWDGWADRAHRTAAIATVLLNLPDPAQRLHLETRLSGADGMACLQALPTLRTQLQQALHLFDTAAAKLDDCLGDAKGASLLPKGGSLDKGAAHCRALAESPALPLWLEYSACRVVLTKAGRGDVLLALDTGKIAPAQLLDLDAYLDWNPQAEQVLTRPGLVGFSAKQYADWRKRFADNDKKSREHTAQAIAARLAKQPIPAGVSGKTLKDTSEQILLKQLIGRKKSPLSIRQVMAQAGEALRAMFPVFMMGPLAIAQYIKPDDDGFDLVVIDEASQLPLEEGLGALARAKQLVVVGDHHQMPPSNLFNKLIPDGDDDGDGDGAALPDAESILHVAQERYPTRRLLWHYRSKHESLIEFSNAKVYGDSLRVFPARQDRPDLGVKLIQVAEPRYVNQSNLPEALTVVASLARLIGAEMVKPAAARRTVGVVAINSKQADLIEECWNERAKIDTYLTEYQTWAEETGNPFFIKNLENVQGDERDVIVISITYGPNGQGKIAQNFGPLSQKGGYRRLNVLITRARLQMIVVSSIQSAEISAAPPAGDGGGEMPGRLMLRRFLAFAADGGFGKSLTASDGAPESPFEESVGGVLRAAGIAFDWQVGSAGARIDIAIRHPTQPGSYVLAIECDGEQYHRAASRREADRLRQERLEAMGWKFHRIWSSDWFNDRAMTEQRLVDACQAALRQAREDGAPVTADLFDGVANIGPVTPVAETAPAALDLDAVSPPEPVIRAGEGTIVVLCEEGKPESAQRYTLVRGAGDPSKGLLGLRTPLGRSLEDKAAGEQFDVLLPRRAEPAHFKVIDVQIAS